MPEEETQEVVEVDPTVREAALAALQDAGLDESNWPTDDSEEEVEESEEDENEEVEEVTPAAATDGDDVPTEYFGVDLSEYPAEKRSEIIAAFKEQDKYAQSLAQKLAAKETEPEPEPQPEDEPLDDDALMKALGVSEDDPMYEVKKEIMVPMARIVQQQQEALSQIQAQNQEQQFISWWESGLDEMESQFGKLPIDREELAVIALEEGLKSPQEAYARVALSGRKTVEDLVAKAQESAKTKAKEAKPRTTRPRSDGGRQKPPTTLMDPAEAAKQAAATLGFDWGDALKQVT